MRFAKILLQINCFLFSTKKRFIPINSYTRRLPTQRKKDLRGISRFIYAPFRQDTSAPTANVTGALPTTTRAGANRSVQEQLCNGNETWSTHIHSLVSTKHHETRSNRHSLKSNSQWERLKVAISVLRQIPIHNGLPSVFHHNKLPSK
jgi:hypothetical protein